MQQTQKELHTPREESANKKQLLSFDTVLDQIIHRPPAEILALVLSKTPVSPDQVTLMSLIPSILSGVFFAAGSFSSAVTGLFFFYLWAVMDHADGSLARRKQLFSKYGQVLDDYCDHAATVFIFLGIFLGLARMWNEKDQAVLALFFYPALAVNTVASILVTYARRQARFEALSLPKVSKKFLWKHKIFDSLMGRDALYLFFTVLLSAHYWGPRVWLWYPSVLDFFVVSMVVISAISIAEFFKCRLARQAGGVIK